MQTLRLFCDVARCQSFSQAASLHGITQSAASQRIGQLEKRLGLTLIDRSVRPLVLTEAGELFREGCEDLLQRYDKLEQRVLGMREDPHGPVRVAAIYSAGIELLERVRERFQQHNPRIRVEIHYEKPDDVYSAVRAKECDVGIVSYPQRWRKVGVIPLRDEVMAVVCNPEHPLAGRARVRPAELSQYPMATFSMDLPAGRRIRQYLREHEAEPMVTHVFDNVDTIKNAVIVTNRWALLPKRTVMREVAVGSLRLIELEPTLVRPLGIIYRRQQRNGAAFDPATQVFVDFLLQHAGPDVDVIAQIEADRGGFIGAGV